MIKLLPLLPSGFNLVVPLERVSRYKRLAFFFFGFLSLSLSFSTPVFSAATLSNHDKSNDKSTPKSIYKEYLSLDQALKGFFPKASTIDAKEITLSPALKKTLITRTHQDISFDSVTLHYAYKEDDFLGYAIVLDQLGKHYPITFITKISPDFKIDDMAVMIYRELYGEKVRKKRFLRQFFGKTSQDELIVDQTITGISGATISSWSMARGAKLALIIVEELPREEVADKLEDKQEDSQKHNRDDGQEDNLEDN